MKYILQAYNIVQLYIYILKIQNIKEKKRVFINNLTQISGYSTFCFRKGDACTYCEWHLSPLRLPITAVYHRLNWGCRGWVIDLLFLRACISLHPRLRILPYIQIVQIQIADMVIFAR